MISPMPEQSHHSLESTFGTIASFVDASATQNLTFLRDLLRIPKPRMQEHEAIRFAADILRKAKCEVDVFAGQGIGETTPAGPPLNVLAHRKGRGGGRSLMLEAHIDTVPTGDVTKWTHDPWGGEIVDGLIYARGSHDDVAGAALICLVAQSLQSTNLNLLGDLYLLLTSEEEYSSGGMRALVARHSKLRPDAHVLVDGNGEPQDCIVGHPGSVCFTIRIPGPFGTAQNPTYLHEGNPIEFSTTLISALRDLEQRLRERARAHPSNPPWPDPSIAIVGIKSVGWISNVPESCDVQVWGNVIPPMTIDEYKREVTNCVLTQARGRPWIEQHPPQIQWGPIEVASLVTSMDSAFYAAVSNAHTRSFGTKLVPRHIGGWGDMRLLGSPNPIFYGPGGGGNCHSYDEHYRLSDFNPMLRSLLYLAAEWCGVAEP
jgi:acetylornithine deacetylase